MLQDAGVIVIGNKGCRFDPSDIGPWCKSSSDESDKPGPAPLASESLCSSACMDSWKQGSKLMTGLMGLKNKAVQSCKGSKNFAPLLKVKHWYTVHQVIIIPSSFYLTDECRTILTVHVMEAAGSPHHDKARFLKKATNNYVIEIINQANMKFGCEDLIDPYNIQPPLDSDLSERDCQAFKDRRQNELFNSASPFTYYLHGQELTDMSVFIVLFTNPVVEDTHIAHWYASKDMPLRDEDMRLEIKTTPTQMFSELAVSCSYVDI
ncbi:hypothetical protein DFH29DRAFT_871092 [Suillus ampliporus]|nr:hypothetical protein DFH29DRAFT_871092 [Suillus ampliporus]